MAKVLNDGVRVQSQDANQVRLILSTTSETCVIIQTELTYLNSPTTWSYCVPLVSFVMKNIDVKREPL